ncbi:AAA family ATPase [Nostoc sp.]|uniref:AAA family ATPase n=1 Tax=Nostoc sp. TaxID=1180 RepID=UPI0035945C2A
MLEITEYKIRSKIHESTNSRVYRGIRERDHLPVIFKILKKDYPTPEEITRYKLEYEITRSLSLKGVIQAYGLQQYQSTFVIILEDFGGESLTKIIAKKRFSLIEFLNLAVQITETLSEIHHANIIHKDINPSNIILNLETQEIKIIDFGISTTRSRETLTLKNPTVLEGTLAYISPEQTGRMNRSLDYRSDFYSLGVTFYQLLTHRLPFESRDALELIHYHLALKPVPPHVIDPEIPVVVSEIVLKLLAKTAEERYQSAWGIKTDLEQCLIQLQHTGRIESFALGQQDISDKFHISEKLYGREREVETLLAAIARLADKASSQVELMLIAGYSGIGKSVLVQEIYQPITQQRGYFISGKFDQYQRNIPYFAIAQAFGSLIKQLLTEDEVQLCQWRDHLLAALGSNSSVITQLIPALELIVGNQPDVLVLPPTEAQNRFYQVFQNFIRVFTQPEHPLVIFLDDLQWADNASLKLIQLLTTTTEKQSLLLIGAYRDNEVNAVHPLSQMVEQIRQSGGVVNQLFLSSLSLLDINQLIADTLRCQPEDSLPLAVLVQLKTDGNPFFMNEFLKSLYTEELVEFDRQTKKWQWSIEQIQNREITDNVVELMAGKIQKLNEQMQQILQLSACIGNSFDLETLAFAAELSQRETAQILGIAIAQGLIIPLSNAHKSVVLDVQLLSNPTIEYKFAHDRIQQAAYSLISEAERQVIHYKVGQKILQNTPPEQHEQRIFDIVNHLNLGSELIQVQVERNELVRLNLMAGEKAKAAAAYTSTLRYMQTGLELLEANSWQNQYNLTLDIFVESAEAEYLNANFAAASALVETVLHQGKTLLDRIKAYELQMQIYIAQRQFGDAADIGLQALELLGYPVSINLDEQDFLINLPTLEQLAAYPIMTDPAQLAALRILKACLSAIFGGRPEILLPVILTQVKLCVKYGHSVLASGAYVWYGIILCNSMSNIDAGYQAGQLALELLKQFYAREYKALIYNMFYTFIQHWKKSVRESLPYLAEGVQSGLETGDNEYAGYCINNYCFYQFLVGENLEIVERSLVNYHDLLLKLKLEHSIYLSQIWHQLLLNLLGKAANPLQLIGESFDESVMLPQLHAENNYYALLISYLAKTILFYTLGDFSQAVDSAATAARYSISGSGAEYFVTLHFYQSLALLANYLDITAEEQSHYLQQIATNQGLMQLWSTHAPMNYLHKWHLVEAERHRVLGEVVEAMDAYDRAIILARQNEYLQEEALANELAAKFHLANKRMTIARAYMQEARYGYLRWGATAKVQDMERQYLQLPLLNQGKLTGIVLLENNLTTNAFTPERIEILRLLSTQAAISIDNARLLKQQAELNESLQAEIADRQQAEKDRDRLIAIMEASTDYIGMADPQGNILWQNTQANKLTEMPLDKGSDFRIPNYHPQWALDLVQNQGIPTAIRDGTWVGETALLDINCQEIPVSQLIIAHKASDGSLEYLSSVTRDISAIKAAEAEVRQLNAELEERVIQRTAQLEAANKALEAFSYSVSHDLRAPLRAIAGFSKIMQEDYGEQLDLEANHHLKVVRDNAKRMGELIDDLLNLSRLDRKEISQQPVFPNEVIQIVLNDLAPDLKGRQIEFAIADLPECQADLSLLKQVWINLLSNAIKYTRYKSLAYIEVGYEVMDGEGVYFIKDNGAGFDMRYADNLFGVFQRFHRDQDFEGTGIGLAIVQRIIQRHGGRIWGQAAIDQGATFYFTIPNKLTHH